MLYIEKINKIIYGLHYSNLNTEEINNFHNHLHLNKYVSNKLDYMVTKGFLSTREDVVNWLAFMKNIYKNPTKDIEIYKRKLAELEVILKCLKLNKEDYTRNYYYEHIKNNIKIFKEPKDLSKFIKMKTLPPKAKKDVNIYIAHLKDMGFRIKALENGYFYLKE